MAMHNSMLDYGGCSRDPYVFFLKGLGEDYSSIPLIYKGLSGKSNIEHEVSIVEKQKELGKVKDMRWILPRIHHWSMECSSLVVLRTCSICYEDMTPEHHDVAELPCKHHFHHECVGRWLGMGKPHCPLCWHHLAWLGVELQGRCTLADVV